MSTSNREMIADARIQCEMARRGYDPDDPVCRFYLNRLQKTAYGALRRAYRAGGLFALATRLGVGDLPGPAPGWPADVDLILEAATVYAAPVWMRTAMSCWAPDGSHLSLLRFFVSHVMRHDFRHLYLEHCRGGHSGRLQIYLCLRECFGPEVFEVGRLWALGHDPKQIAEETGWSRARVSEKWAELERHLRTRHNIVVEENP